MSLEVKSDLVRAATGEAAKASPPLALHVGAVLGGWTLQEWVWIATLSYIALQAAYLVCREGKGDDD